MPETVVTLPTGATKVPGTIVDPGMTTQPVDPPSAPVSSPAPPATVVQIPGTPPPPAPTNPTGSVYTAGPIGTGLPPNPGFPGLGEDPNAFAGTGLDVYRRAADPTAISNAYQTYLRQVLTPGLLNTLTASGMGRSGAEGEALAGAAAKMAPQIATQQQDALQKWAQALLGVWNPMYNRYAYPPVSPFDFGGGDSGGGDSGGDPSMPSTKTAPWWAGPAAAAGAAAIPGLIGAAGSGLKWLIGKLGGGNPPPEEKTPPQDETPYEPGEPPEWGGGSDGNLPWDPGDGENY